MSTAVTIPRSQLGDRVNGLTSISLQELNEVAALQTRVDRKYILTDFELIEMVDSLAPRLSTLDIDGNRSFTYQSVYFDTPELDCFRAAAHRRRRRFKVRTRTYCDAASTMLEVKTKGGRKVTVKQRQPHRYEDRGDLDPAGRAFIVGAADCTPTVARSLIPVLITRYRRATLVDLDDIARLTIDADLLSRDRHGCSLSLQNHYIIETKTAGPPSAADRWLWANGRRPEKVSKFGTSLAALNPGLPANKWHRTVNRYFRPNIDGTV
ncbi:MAG: polyphosphate polymerase domain-containing protein [Actinomycetia bacterium]|nr:polyphosphate polymerase domain-containing protein [Actinomycetes bacterium]